MTGPSFEWDEEKSRLNQEKHGVAFEIAQLAFFDSRRVIADDVDHSTEDERRFYCFGWVEDGVLTVRFTVRGERIRIFGAGYWRRGKRIYEHENEKIHARRDWQGEGD